MGIFRKDKTENRKVILKREDYAYCMGRFRSLESTLLSRSVINRVFDAESEAEISRVLSENGFSASGSAEEAIRADLTDSYALARKLIPDTEYIDALLCVNDYHNLKVILKSLIPGNTFINELETDSDYEILDPEKAISDFFGSGAGDFMKEGVSSNFMFPSRYDPEDVYASVSGAGDKINDERLSAAAEDALKSYIRTSDPGDIDTVADIHYFRQLSEYDTILDNEFFHEYIAFKADSANLGILLRLRAMKADPERIGSVCVEGGEVPRETVISLYSRSTEDIRTAFRTACGGLTNIADNYGSGHTALEFGKAADDHIINMLHKTRSILFGPEIILAYLIAKEMQAKNLNIALTCIRNKVPASLAAEMMRNTF